MINPIRAIFKLIKYSKSFYHIVMNFKNTRVVYNDVFDFFKEK